MDTKLAAFYAELASQTARGELTKKQIIETLVAESAARNYAHVYDVLHQGLPDYLQNHSPVLLLQPLYELGCLPLVFSRAAAICRGENVETIDSKAELLRLAKEMIQRLSI